MRDVTYPPIIVAAKTAFRLLGQRFLMTGTENVPRSGGVLLAYNHIGYVDFVYGGLAANPSGRLVRFMAERELFFKSKDWRLQDITARSKIPKQAEIESHSFKTVGFARNLVNNYTFEQDRNQYLLIRLLARTQNSNLFLFLDQFKKRFPNSTFLPHVNLALAETTVERYKKLLDIQGINRADYDVAVNQANSLRADIQILQANLSKTVVRAPFSGVVGLRQTSNVYIV